MEKAYIYNTKLGKIMMKEDGIGITELSLMNEIDKPSDKDEFLSLTESGCEIEETLLIQKAAIQMDEYLNGSRKEFTIPLNPKGTEFQQKVWEALRTIPYGETRSYKQIAQQVGNAKASRAVGMANHNNPIMCIIPCHRVIGADGKLVGYAGGLNIKEALLNLEKKV